MNAPLTAIGLGDLSFSAGAWLWALPVAALPLLLRRSTTPGERGPHLRGPLHSNHRWRASLESIAIAMLTLALAGPRLPGGSVQVVRYGSDVVFVLDVSRSMLATDLEPTRLERAKTEIRLLTEQLGNHRLGLVAFAGTAVAFPLTLDRQAVNLFLRDLSVLDIPVQGTAIALALKRARETLSGARANGTQAASIVLVTDGEDHAGNLAQATEDLKAAGVTVHVRALGSEKAVPVPATDDQGNIVGTHRDRRGKTAETRYTKDGERALRRLAEGTGGTYAHVPSAGFGQRALRSALDAAPRAKRTGETQALFRPLYALPLGSALLAWLASWLIPVARSRPRLWQRTSAAGLVPFLVHLSSLGITPGFVAGCSTGGPEATDIAPRTDASANNKDEHDRSASVGREALAEARRHFLAGRYAEAVAGYEAETHRYGSDPRFQLNLALAHLALGHTETARVALRAALSTARSEDIKADLFYNLGRLLLAEGEAQEESGSSGKQAFTDAANAFRDALRHRLPDARSAHNLQVALAKLAAASDPESDPDAEDSDDSDAKGGDPGEDTPDNSQPQDAQDSDADANEPNGSAPDERGQQESTDAPKDGEDPESSQAPEGAGRDAEADNASSNDHSSGTADEQAPANDTHEAPNADTEAQDSPDARSAETGGDDNDNNARAGGRSEAAPTGTERDISSEDRAVMLRALDALQQGEGSFYKEQARQDARRRRLPQTSQDW